MLGVNGISILKIFADIQILAFINKSIRMCVYERWYYSRYVYVLVFFSILMKFKDY